MLDRQFVWCAHRIPLQKQQLIKGSLLPFFVCSGTFFTGEYHYMNTAMLNKIQFDQIREQVAHYVLGNHTKERLDATLPSSNLATVINWQQ